MLKTTCRVKTLFIKNAVTINNQYPADSLSRVFLFIGLLFLSACNNWPECSERVLALSDRMTEQPKQINRNYIDGLLDIAVTRLAILEASGAQYCLPGQVSRINKYLFRARHEVDGNLLLDAQFSLVKTMEHLEYTSELMFGLAEGSECLDHYALSTKDNQRDAVERYLASLNRLLNCDCDQITDDDILVENFYERLAIVGKALSTHDQLFVRIYASEHSDQVKEIISYFF